VLKRQRRKKKFSRLREKTPKFKGRQRHPIRVVAPIGRTRVAWIKGTPHEKGPVGKGAGPHQREDRLKEDYYQTEGRFHVKAEKSKRRS